MEEFEDEVTTCSKKNCENNSESYRMYVLDDSSKDYIYIEDRDFYSALCEECVPKSYKECMNCRTLTKKSCSVASCDVRMCKVHQKLGQGEHDWYHGPSKNT